MNTPLENYLAVTIQMLIARLDNRDEDPYLDKLDELWKALTTEDIEFVNEMGKDWSSHSWCTSCKAAHLKEFKCPNV